MPRPNNAARYFITGGAGFIGSHLTDRLIKTGAVTVYDNLSSGKLDFIKDHLGRDGFNFIRGDLLDTDTLRKAIAGHDIVFHLAANPEVRAGIQATCLDLREGTTATWSVLGAMRLNHITKLVFTSSSTVYGDAGTTPVTEDHGPLVSISLYGAVKLGSEALIATFCHLFDMQAWCFRLANVVGARLTHGVIYDFINKLKRDPGRLEILGDGLQQKPYLHVFDCVSGMLFGLEHAHETINVFNLGPSSSTSVTAIAGMVALAMGLANVKLNYAGAAARAGGGTSPRSGWM